MPPERAYLIRRTGRVKDENGGVTEVLAEYDPESRGGDPADGRKVRGATIHWVDAATAIDAGGAAVRQPVHRRGPGRRRQELSGVPEPQLPGGPHRPQGGAFPGGCRSPASFQFMRLGYFCLDSKDSKPGHLVFNRSVSLKDSFKK